MFKGPILLYDGKALEKSIQSIDGSLIEMLEALVGPSVRRFLRKEPLHYPTDSSKGANMRRVGVSDMADALLCGLGAQADRLLPTSYRGSPVRIPAQLQSAPPVYDERHTRAAEDHVSGPSPLGGRLIYRPCNSAIFCTLATLHL